MLVRKMLSQFGNDPYYHDTGPLLWTSPSRDYSRHARGGSAKRMHAVSSRRY